MGIGEKGGQNSQERKDQAGEEEAEQKSKAHIHAGGDKQGDGEKGNRAYQTSVHPDHGLSHEQGYGADWGHEALENSNDWILIRLAASSSIERMLHHLINIAELAINLNNATLRVDRTE